MSRVTTKPGASNAPRIDHQAVAEFFEQRAKKFDALGAVRTVIYQDKHPDLAERRDAAEKALLAPKLQLSQSSRVLDVGCGVGRWTSLVAGQCGHYHGADFSPGLIERARAIFAQQTNVRFSVSAADSLSLAGLNEQQPFDRILSLGVMIYQNDDEVLRALRAIAEVAAPRNTILLVREPLGVTDRLTIKEHFSSDMDQMYNAIYRTEDELLGMAKTAFADRGLVLADRGNVYDAADLNNRPDTIQRWFTFRN